MELNEQQRQTLLDLAYESIVQYLSTRQTPAVAFTDPALLQPCGAFVTLHRHGNLRGCIGHIIADQPLYQVVQQMAVSAAVYDPRFNSMSLSETENLDVEISALSPMQTITNPEELIVGTHGILISKVGHRGLLLPQVATEQHWDRYTLLEAVCQKAGLPSGGWKHGAHLQVFSAIIFSKHFHRAKNGVAA